MVEDSAFSHKIDYVRHPNCTAGSKVTAIDFAEWMDFAYWWSFSGGGSAINGATPSSL